MSTNATLIAFGRTSKTMTPSGRIFIVREQNGNDDDILSNPTTNSNLSNYDNFLVAILVAEVINEVEIPVTLQSVENFLINDRTHLLMFSRIHTLGSEMKFTWNWGDLPINEGGGKFHYAEDLKPYLHNYTEEFPKEGEEGYFKYKIPAYCEGAYGKFEILTKSGKKLRFNLWNRQSEKLTLSLLPEQMTKNSELLARNLEIDMDNKWERVSNFSMFTKLDMIEIHAKVNEIDNSTYMAISEITHPHTKEIVKYPILASTDFFFPLEV